MAVPNPWLSRRVIAFAHQGGAREAPSSTLYAIEQAIAAGADAIELDVHATSDGVLVVCHDPTLDRTTNAAGPIAEHTWSELSVLDNAFNFVPGEDAQLGRSESDYPLRGKAPADRRLGIARLEDVLEAFPTVPLNLDIKQTSPAVEPYEATLAALLGRYGRSDDVIVASFNDASTAAFSRLAPQIGTSPGATLLGDAGRAVLAGTTLDAAVIAALARHVAVQVPASYGGVRFVDERFVALAHDLGLAVHVWTIDDPEEMATLVETGVDGIMTDRPSVLAGVLAERGAAWRGAV
jgi:glycerophosphoryl diester phosphodiesterase